MQSTLHTFVLAGALGTFTLSWAETSAPPVLASPVVVDYQYGLDVYYSANSARLPATQETKIYERLTQARLDAPKVKERCALVAGYSESQEGNNNVRQVLAVKRATSVKRLLLTAGIAEASVHIETSISHDMLYPAGDARNRRAEIEIFPCWKQ